MTLHLEFKNFDAVHTRLVLLVNGTQAGEFTMRNAVAIWFDRLLLAGSQALHRNEQGEFGYGASGKEPLVTDLELEHQVRTT
jgi:hypothetical protein